MKRSLRGAIRGLLALSLLVSLVGLCPCVDASNLAMDCCEPGALSISEMCCVGAAASPAPASPASVLLQFDAPSAVRIALASPGWFLSATALPVVFRPVVARAVLRI